MVVEMLVMEVINMKNTIIQEIEQSLLNYLDNSQLDVLHTVLCRCLDKVEIKMVEDTDIHISEFTNMELINKFIAAKEIEGCSERTTKYYYATLIKMDSMITKNATHLTTDDLRMYLTEYQKINNCSKASIDNIRRNLSSFFSWLEEENYILKSPMKRIHKIKTDKVIKETYSDETLELLRDNCNNLRDLAIIDLLSSTGMRVGELVRLNINDIDFENRECVVFGKGNKERPVYFDARTKIHLRNYIKIFNKDYPELKGYAEVIDNKINYSQTLIDQFSDPRKLPQIAISVDMLDTGIDVPECVNLIFFKKVMSKAKFWQMIGRGTRLCPGLLDGKDKDKFLIFDFCGNFEFFRMKTGSATPNMLAVQGAVFALKFEIAYKLQALNYQTDELKKWRKELVDYMVSKVKELDRNRFDVRQHLKYVDLYSNPDHYQMLTYEDCLMVRQELAPLILPDEDEVSAVRFDALMYGIELAHLAEKQSKRRIKDLLKKVTGLSKVSNIPAIEKESEIIHAILNTNYLEYSGIEEFENIRLRLRDLIKYIPRQGLSYETNFEDDILDVQFNDSELENDDLKNYKSKIEYYIRQHQKDNPVILKIKENKPLSSTDLVSLENILWKELGSKKDYYSEVGEKPICEFVREIVGLDMNAAKDAFSKYLDERNLNSEQIYFVNQIVEYIVRNGLMKDMSVLQQSPFTDKGSVADLFGNDIQTWMEIKSVIDNINNNANYN